MEVLEIETEDGTPGMYSKAAVLPRSYTSCSREFIPAQNREIWVF